MENSEIYYVCITHVVMKICNFIVHFMILYDCQRFNIIIAKQRNSVRTSMLKMHCSPECLWLSQCRVNLGTLFGIVGHITAMDLMCTAIWDLISVVCMFVCMYVCVRVMGECISTGVLVICYKLPNTSSYWLVFATCLLQCRQEGTNKYWDSKSRTSRKWLVHCERCHAELLISFAGWLQAYMYSLA